MLAMADLLGILQGLVGGLLVWLGTIVRERWQRDWRKRDDLRAAYSRCLTSARIVTPQLESLCVTLNQVDHPADRDLLADVQRTEPAMRDFLSATYEVLLVEGDQTRRDLVSAMVTTLSGAYECLLSFASGNYSEILRTAQLAKVEADLEERIASSPPQIQKELRLKAEETLGPRRKKRKDFESRLRVQNAETIEIVRAAVNAINTARDRLVEQLSLRPIELSI
jgi:hypothetical protein